MNISLGKAIGLAVASAMLSALVTAAILKKEPSVVADAAKPASEVRLVSKPEISPEPDRQAALSPAIDLEAAMSDRAIGSKDAPITIIEYASMTCDHCAAFHNKALPEVKTQLIETGKARLIFRDMPWDKFALKASKMARCVPAEKYFEMLETIFKTQGHWAHSEDPLKGLRDVGLAAGMDEKYLDACLDSEPLEKAIIQKQQEAMRELGVKATPTFIFMKGEERQERFPEFEEIFQRAGEHKH